MGLEIRQNLRLTQQLIMTQKLQQAIKLLQLSRMELLEEIQQVLEANPVLEEQVTEDRTPDTPEAEAWAASRPEPEDSREEAPDRGETRSLAEEWDWEKYLQDQQFAGNLQEYEEREVPSFENLNAQQTTLKSHLMWQLKMARLDEAEETLGALIIGNLDADGYLRATVEELAQDSGATPERVEQVLGLIQSFDPPGIGARDLKECLLLQLNHQGLQDPLVIDIVKHHLANLGNRNYQVIARDLKVSLDEVARAIDLIAKLDPKPGSRFDAEDPAYINPDVYVHKVGDDYVITLNEDGLPKLRVNSFYLESLRHPENLSDAAKSYIQKHLDSALWFIRSIHQRQKTLQRVSESIIRFQRDFLDHGLAHLRPLTLRQVAEDVNMHESTISRVTTGKYIHTPQGVLDMKYFFNSGINLGLGDQIASESVKEKIRQLVQSENPENPLSDQEIADLLRKDDVLIARRTVAKYRGMLGVLPSSKRKRPALRGKTPATSPS
jgi:RNA polymerase sigma-54 factor